MMADVTALCYDLLVVDYYRNNNIHKLYDINL